MAEWRTKTDLTRTSLTIDELVATLQAAALLGYNDATERGKRRASNTIFKQLEVRPVDLSTPERSAVTQAYMAGFRNGTDSLWDAVIAHYER